MRGKAAGALFLLCSSLLAATSAEATPTCTAPARLMQWPLPQPVWEFCMGTNGSGIDLYEPTGDGDGDGVMLAQILDECLLFPACEHAQGDLQRR